MWALLVVPRWAGGFLGLLVMVLRADDWGLRVEAVVVAVVVLVAVAVGCNES